MYEIKKIVVKEVFEHLKRKLFNTYIDDLLHSSLLLMEFSGSSLGYDIIVNQLCTSVSLYNFLYHMRLKVPFENINLVIFQLLS